MKAPKDFVYHLPDDYIIKPHHRERLDKIMGELNATEEQAQEVIDLHVEIVEETLKEFSLGGDYETGRYDEDDE